MEFDFQLHLLSESNQLFTHLKTKENEKINHRNITDNSFSSICNK